MKLALTALSICLLSAAATAGEQAQDCRAECTSAAFAEYNKAMSPLIRTGDVSVESQLARRRLAQIYCLKWAHCLIDGSNIDLPALAPWGERSPAVSMTEPP
jgi:hypothetical protein